MTADPKALAPEIEQIVQQVCDGFRADVARIMGVVKPGDLTTEEQSHMVAEATTWRSRCLKAESEITHLTAQLAEAGAENVRLRGALQALFDDYKALADSGDAGFWRLELTEVGQATLEVLASEPGQ